MLLILVMLASFVLGIPAAIEWFAKARGASAESFLIPLALFVGSIGLYWLSEQLTRARYRRALALASQLGFSPKLIEEYFGQRTSENKVLPIEWFGEQPRRRTSWLP
jgi:hypothetical protein